jgi:hypothetical protein
VVRDAGREAIGYRSRDLSSLCNGRLGLDLLECLG